MFILLLTSGFPSLVVAQSENSITNPTSVASIFLSLLVVIAIIFSLAYVMRRFTVTHAGGGQLKVVASMMAGNKERIMVVQVGDEQVMLGITAHNINHLHTLSKPLDVPDTTNAEAFKEKLIQAMAGKLQGGAKSAQKTGEKQ